MSHDTRRPPVDRKQAASHLGISERQLRDLVYRRCIPYVKIGRTLRFLPEDLDHYLDTNRVPVQR